MPCGAIALSMVVGILVLSKHYRMTGVLCISSCACSPVSCSPEKATATVFLSFTLYWWLLLDSLLRILYTAYAKKRVTNILNYNNWLKKPLLLSYFIINVDYCFLTLLAIVIVTSVISRFVVVCGDGEYIIYTAMALRNKSFGSAQEFAWAHDSSE